MEGHAIHFAHTGSRWDVRIEILIAIVLGLSAVAGAYAAYEREGEEHDAQALFASANTHLTESSAEAAIAQQKLNYDGQLFMQWAVTDASDKTDLLEHAMGPEMTKAAYWWWHHDWSEGGATPMTSRNPHWRPPAELEAARTESERSRESFAQGREHQESADSYTRVEIVLATALFLLGVAGVTRNARIRLAGTALGTLIFVGSIVLLAGI